MTKQEKAAIIEEIKGTIIKAFVYASVGIVITIIGGLATFSILLPERLEAHEKSIKANSEGLACLEKKIDNIEDSLAYTINKNHRELLEILRRDYKIANRGN